MPTSKNTTTMIKPMAPSFFSRKSRERKVIKALFLAGCVSGDDTVLLVISIYYHVDTVGRPYEAGTTVRVHNTES